MNTNTFLSTICDYRKVEHMVCINNLKMIKSNISLNFKYTSCIKTQLYKHLQYEF